MTVGQIQVSPPFSIELTPERICLLQGAVPRSTHHLFLLPHTGYLDPWLQLHTYFHNVENKADRRDMNIFDVFIVPTVRWEFQKVTEVFLVFHSPLFLPPMLSSSSSERTESEAGLLHLQRQMSTEPMIFPKVCIRAAFQMQHLRDSFSDVSWGNFTSELSKLQVMG